MAVEGITFEFSVGGDHKMNSSSSLLKDWQYTSDDRVWGKFYNLFQDSRIKVKELIIDPGKGISFQRHQKRSEVWFISKGSCLVKHSSTEPENASDVELGTDDIFHVRQGDWHQLINPSEVACHVIEIQYGASTSEDDIERLFFYKGN
jgi:mannose-6-phosphate isomerase